MAPLKEASLPVQSISQMLDILHVCIRYVCVYHLLYINSSKRRYLQARQVSRTSTNYWQHLQIEEDCVEMSKTIWKCYTYCHSVYHQSRRDNHSYWRLLFFSMWPEMLFKIEIKNCCLLTFGVPACLIASESEQHTDASSASMTAIEGNGSTPHSRRIDSLWNKIPPAQVMDTLGHITMWVMYYGMNNFQLLTKESVLHPPFGAVLELEWDSELSRPAVLILAHLSEEVFIVLHDDKIVILFSQSKKMVLGWWYNRLTKKGVAAQARFTA